jgi:hypothetical protein
MQIFKDNDHSNNLHGKSWIFEWRSKNHTWFQLFITRDIATVAGSFFRINREGGRAGTIILKDP